MHEGRIKLPKNPRLIRQLKEVVAKPTPGGGLSITSPRRKGAGHGDLVSALVLAIWEAKRAVPDAGREVREQQMRDVSAALGYAGDFGRQFSPPKESPVQQHERDVEFWRAMGIVK